MNPKDRIEIAIYYALCAAIALAYAWVTAYLGAP